MNYRKQSESPTGVADQLPLNHDNGRYTPESQHVLARSAGKGKGKMPESGYCSGAIETKKYGSCPIELLPVECISHVFAQLNPVTLAKAQLVCKSWQAIISDESNWMRAFMNYYSIILAPSSTGRSKHCHSIVSLGRRLNTSSWRSEYTLRVSLLDKWTRSRASSIIHNPMVGPVSSIFFQPPHQYISGERSNSRSRDNVTGLPSLSHSGKASSSRATLDLLSVSEPMGTSVRSSPFTGKVSHRYLPVSPIDNIGQPLLEDLPSVAITCFVVAPGGDKVVWGMLDGSIRLVSTGFTGSTSARGSANGWNHTQPQSQPVGGLMSEAGTVRTIRSVRGSAVSHIAFSSGLHPYGSNSSSISNATQKTSLPARDDHFASVHEDCSICIYRMLVTKSEREREHSPPALLVWSATAGQTSGHSLHGQSDLNRFRALPSLALRPTTLVFDTGWTQSTRRNHSRNAMLAVGMSDGSVALWTEVLLGSEIDSLSTTSQSEMRLKPYSDAAVDNLCLDISSSGDSFQLFVHHRGSSVFYQYAFSRPPSLLASFTHVGTCRFESNLVVFGPLTSFAFDFNDASISNTLNRSTDLSTRVVRADVPVSYRNRESVASTSLSMSSISSLTRSSSAIDSIALELGSTDAIMGLDEHGQGPLRFGRQKYVISGDAHGSVALWAWGLGTGNTLETVQDEVDSRRPSKVLKGTGNRVTALTFTELTILVGYLDGSIRVYDILTLHLLRTFKERAAPRQHAGLLAAGLVAASDEDRWKVSHIIAGQTFFIAAVGIRVISWQLDYEQRKSKKHSGPKGINSGRGSARLDKYRFESELRQEVQDSLHSISNESEARIAKLRRERLLNTEYGLPPSLNNMTEEEAVAFAIMLSTEEEEAKWDEETTQDSPSFASFEDEIIDMDGLDLDQCSSVSEQSSIGTPSPSSQRKNDSKEEEDFDAANVFMQSPTSSPYSHHLSVPTSPTLRGSSLGRSSSPSSLRSIPYGWRPGSQPSSPSFLPTTSPNSWQSSTKIQLSPRLGPTYGFLPSSKEPPPDLNNEELWPLAQPFSGPASPSKININKPNVNSTPVTIVKRGWSDVAKSGSNLTPDPSRIPVSSLAAGVPSFSMLTQRINTSSSRDGHHHPSLWNPPLSRNGAANSSSTEEEDLRLAIELSLAESLSESTIET